MIAVGGYLGGVMLTKREVVLPELFVNHQKQAHLLCGDDVPNWVSVWVDKF